MHLTSNTTFRGIFVFSQDSLFFFYLIFSICLSWKSFPAYFVEYLAQGAPESQCPFSCEDRLGIGRGWDVFSRAVFDVALGVCSWAGCGATGYNGGLRQIS